MARAGCAPTCLRFCLATLVSLWAFGCTGSDPAEPPPPPEVRVTNPEQREVTRYFEYTGTLAALQVAQIRARVPGFLSSVEFKESSEVEENQLLFRIERGPYEATVARMEADLSRAKAQRDLAQLRLTRSQQAEAEGAASELELIEFRAELAQREAEVLAAEASLREARIQLDYTEVRAPFAGRVDRNYVDIGNLVGDGERTLLATIRQMAPIYAYFDVSERIALQYIGRGDRGNMPEQEPHPIFVGLADEEGYPHEGVIDFVDNEVDASTGTIRVRAVLPNENKKLFPGLFVRIRAPFETDPDAIVVQENAVGIGLEGPYLLLVGEDNMVRRQAIEIGQRQDDGSVLVSSGVTPEDVYIMEGLQRARPGRPVRPIRSGDPTPASAGGGG